MTVLDNVLEGLMTRYKERVPAVNQVISAMVMEGLINSMSDIENDHIAFRTLGVPHLGIGSLEKIFLYYGYTKEDYYYFKKKKLDAYWYSPPSEQYPRIFISELRVPELSSDLQALILFFTQRITADPVDSLNLDNSSDVNLFLHSPLWKTPSWDQYVRAQEESEYAAWVLYNRYYLNHFTISVHNLPPGYNTIEEFNMFLEKNKIILNDSNGKIKVSKDGLLIQSSTVASIVTADFGGETHDIPGSYVEFAERRVLSEFTEEEKPKRSMRRDGFDTGNADGMLVSNLRFKSG